jgi:hypothetical protein
MDTAKLTYKGKEYPVRISYYTMKHFTSETGKEIGEIGKSDYSPYETLLYYSLVSGHRFEGQLMELEKEDMEEMLDHVFFEFLGIIPLFFPKLKVGETQPGKKKE